MVFSSLRVDDRVVSVPVAALVLVDSPRLLGENAQHVLVLAEIETDLPPILVHRSTMRVLDGVHRVRAAMLRGEPTIAAQLFDGTDNEAFVLSVRENVVHGLPLSLSDRRAAAARILGCYPQWSDRAIAAVVGLAPSSVGVIRKCSTARPEQLSRRIGRDGRIRRLPGEQHRQRVRDVIAARPDASLREIARAAHVSLGTAHAVAKHLEQATESSAVTGARPARSRRRNADGIDWVSLRQRLATDPTVRYTEAGRQFVRWLDSHAISAGDWARIHDSVPPHWSDALAGLAERFSQEWLDFAKALQQRGEAM